MASLHGVFTESEVAMDGITDSGAQSIQAVNEILQAVTKESTDQAVKLMKATVETAVGKEVGKGNAVDTEG